MAISQAELDNLDAAIASGEEEVQDGRRRMKRRSVEELIAARKYGEAQAAATAGTRVRRARIELKPGA